MIAEAATAPTNSRWHQDSYLLVVMLISTETINTIKGEYFMRENYAKRRKNDQKHIARKAQIIKDVYDDGEESYNYLTRDGKQKHRLSKANIALESEKSSKEYSHADKKKFLTENDEY